MTDSQLIEDLSAEVAALNRNTVKMSYLAESFHKKELFTRENFLRKRISITNSLVNCITEEIEWLHSIQPVQEKRPDKIKI
ncbi:Uncharacterised protein [uncultured archaeon]|nr:Uncharacterised protein [uncultured archaeon]